MDLFSESVNTMLPKKGSYMAKKVKLIEKEQKRILVSNKPLERIEPVTLAAGIGAVPCGVQVTANVDPISLAELGSALISRLRSSGGRPALEGATEICRVPVSQKDLQRLEEMTCEVAQQTGTRPSPGQLASLIVHKYLTEPDKPSISHSSITPSPPWPDDWNGNRKHYRDAQKQIEQAKSTWGRKDAA